MARRCFTFCAGDEQKREQGWDEQGGHAEIGLLEDQDGGEESQ